MAGKFGGNNIWWIAQIMPFGGFYSQDSCSPTALDVCSLAVEILADCSQNCQSAKIIYPHKFLAIYVV